MKIRYWKGIFPLIIIIHVPSKCLNMYIKIFFSYNDIIKNDNAKYRDDFNFIKTN